MGSIKIRTVIPSLVILALLVSFSVVSAHGKESSLEYRDNGYLIDVEYSADVFTDETSTVFKFKLQDADGIEVSFTDVWLRVVKDQSTVLATGIYNARLGGTIITYKFPDSGDYELNVRYQNDGKSIAEASFPIEVLKGDEPKKVVSGIIPIVASGLLLALIFFFKFKRKGTSNI